MIAQLAQPAEESIRSTVERNMLEKKEYARNLPCKIVTILHNTTNYNNDDDDVGYFSFQLMLPFKGYSNFRNTWPPAQASSCGNLSTLQPTGCHEKNPMSQRRSNDVTRRSNVRF